MASSTSPVVEPAASTLAESVATQSNCYLLFLPRELRDEIWSLALLTSNRPAEYIARPPPLLQTSHQTRTEAREIYYKHTLFLDDTTNPDSFNGTNTTKWLKSLSQTSRQHITFIGLIMPQFQLRAWDGPTWIACKRIALSREEIREKMVAVGVKREVVRFLTEDRMGFEVEEADGSKGRLELKSTEVSPEIELLGTEYEIEVEGMD